MNSTPTVSVILSVFRSESTLERSLQALREQTYRDYEVIIVDSSPDSTCEQIVQQQFPGFRYFRFPNRLDVDVARNLGYEKSVGKLVGSTDPDTYADTDWLAELVASHDQRGGLVIGGIACFGDRWIDLGAHLCKFDKWLAGGPARPLPDGPSANMLLSRELIGRVGGFMGNVHGDTDLCWRIREQGGELWLSPSAVVRHHHLHTWSSLLSERYARGKEFGELWLSWNPQSSARLVWRLLITLFPVRLVAQLLRIWNNATQSGLQNAYFQTLPITVTGLYSWLLGEALAYITSPSGALPRRA